MLPTPFEPHTADLILQYISPPSNLQPLPSHLISKSLLQRHHFLGISASNPTDYLCWPSNIQSEAVDLLESCLINESPPAYQVRYTFDGDFAYAHVNIAPTHDRGLRLIFQWDSLDENWRYHDLNLMPFPTGAKTSPQEIVGYYHDAKVGYDGTPLVVTHDSFVTDDYHAYWDDYGAVRDPDGEAYNVTSSTEVTEDAYWAQYASVHGSADSTVPSPLPEHGRKQLHFGEDPNPNDVNAPENDIVSIPISALYPARQPSPNALAHILSSIPPRSPQFTPPTLENPLVTLPECGLAPPESGVAAKRRKSAEVDTSKLKQPHPLEPDTPSFLCRNGVNNQLSRVSAVDEAEGALKDAVIGLYRLWKSQRSGGNKDMFLRVVQETIQSS